MRQVEAEFKLQNGLITQARSETMLQKGPDIQSPIMISESSDCPHNPAGCLTNICWGTSHQPERRSRAHPRWLWAKDPLCEEHWPKCCTKLRRCSQTKASWRVETRKGAKLVGEEKLRTSTATLQIILVNCGPWESVVKSRLNVVLNLNPWSSC